MKELFWETVRYIYMDEDKTYIVFINGYSDKHFVFCADGDCCSTSWFESVTNQENLAGEKIIGMVEKPETEDEGAINGDDDCVKVYGYTLITAKGHIDVEFRNSSNGYYGGSCYFVRDTKLIFPNIPDDPDRIPIRWITIDNSLGKKPQYAPSHVVLSKQLPLSMTIGDSKKEIKLYPYVDGKLLWIPNLKDKDTSEN